MEHFEKSITVDILEHLKNKSITLDILGNFEKKSITLDILENFEKLHFGNCSRDLVEARPNHDTKFFYTTSDGLPAKMHFGNCYRDLVEATTKSLLFFCEVSSEVSKTVGLYSKSEKTICFSSKKFPSFVNACVNFEFSENPR